MGSLASREKLPTGCPLGLPAVRGRPWLQKDAQRVCSPQRCLRTSAGPFLSVSLRRARRGRPGHMRDVSLLSPRVSGSALAALEAGTGWSTARCAFSVLSRAETQRRGSRELGPPTTSYHEEKPFLFSRLLS
uniref:Uncharacterized protein n=1 Tax=Molossus molossus TaxID=27622 RepID=A0A7J8J117_MOLMO|nr:hypothetical protein HJG59_010245 [Molossus molossus]